MALFTWPAQHPTTAGLIFVTLISLASYYAYSQYHLNHTRREVAYIAERKGKQ